MARARADVRVLGLPGSLRRASLNRRLLEASAGLAPAGLSVVVHPLHGIPPYNADTEAAGLPPSVRRLKQAIDDADALLIVTPEYNAGIPGVLKNAIDWASRPAYRSPLVAKPVALMGGTPGLRGIERALEALRQVLASTLAEPLPRAISVARLHDKLADGELSDAALAADVERLLDELRGTALGAGRQVADEEPAALAG